jgi:hypothetical protein
MKIIQLLAIASLFLIVGAMDYQDSVDSKANHGYMGVK